MCARVSRVPPRGSSRSPSRIKKMGLNVDLNFPAIENHDEGTSTSTSRPHAVPNAQLLSVNVEEEDDDDVLISSPRTFAKAKDKSRRNRGSVVNEDAEGSSVNFNNPNKRHRLPGNRQMINYESYVDLECETYNLKGKHNSRPDKQISQPPPSPEELTFSCPVCLGPLVEEMSTKCGHIFCKACITKAISYKKKCPTCRKKTTMKNIVRIYIPSAS